MELELVLPWPSKDLSPNARIHWARRATAAKAARHEAYLLAVAAGWPSLKFAEGRIHLWIDFFPPTRRMPDDDNMLARCKGYRDGIADALGVDDRVFVSHPFVRNEPRKGGEVHIRITAGATDSQSV